MAKILLLEPDVLLARNISTLLKNKGHNISWHRDAQSAISSIDKNIPDLIICELHLTGHSGVEFLYELRSYVEWQSIPLIIFSHAPDAEPKKEQWRELNVSSYHYKPTTKLADIARVVEQTLDTSPAKNSSSEV